MRMHLAGGWLPGKIFDSIIAFLKHPEEGRGGFQSAIVTYVIVMALQGAFSFLAEPPESEHLCSSKGCLILGQQSEGG